MALVYLPERVWSTRFGPDYFTVAIIGYRIHEDQFAQYELQVQNGKKHWTVLRRFSEFDNLRWRLAILIALGSVRNKAGSRLPDLPPKTFWCRDLNPDFLTRRKNELQVFLHNLLVIPSVADDPSAREFLHLPKSTLLYV